MTFAPGSTLWLLQHELRLVFRGLASRRGRGKFAKLWLTVVTPLIFVFAVGVPLGFVLRHVSVPMERLSFLIGDVIVVVAFTLMLSQTLLAAVEALYQRADLDLLFSSPLDPRRVMTVRFLGVAVGVTTTLGFFIAPALVPIAVMGHPEWLAALLVLLAIGLTATGVGLALSTLLFRLLGPRRTRTVGQIMAAFVGAAVFLAGQAYNILGKSRASNWSQRVVEMAHDPNFHPPLGYDLPLRALLGQPGPLAMFLAIGAVVFLATTIPLGRSFAADAAAAAGAGAGSARRKDRANRAFATGAFAVTYRKELRLLFRDPAFLAQVLLRVLYLIPVGLLAVRSASAHMHMLLPGAAGMLALVTSQLAGSLAWVCVSAEDAPDLLTCSPTPQRVLNRAKIAAAATPAAVLLVPLLVPLTVFAPWIGLVGAVGCAAAIWAMALTNIWWQRPGKRSEFRNARRSSIAVALAELFIGLMIAGATTLLAAFSPLGLIPAGVAAGVLLLLRRDERQVAESLRLAAARG